MKKTNRKPLIQAPKPLPKAQPYKAPYPSKSLSIKQAEVWNLKLSSAEYTQRRLTFGEYANVMIRDVPTDYIKWGILNLNTTWAEMFARELQRREPEFKRVNT